MDSRDKLSAVKIAGFKSIAPANHAQDIGFGDVTVIIGANGAGKSNLVSFFKMLNMMCTSALQEFIGRQGTATSILHYGPKTTARIEAEIHFTQGKNKDTYCFSLAHASGDRLIFTEESVSWHKTGDSKPHRVDLGVGHAESQLREKAAQGDKTCEVMYRILRNCQVYQFHDTSSESRIRNNVDLANEHFLYSDGGNLAVYLYAMKQSANHRKYYDRIVRRIRDIVPQFGDFVLEPSALNKNFIALNWREANGRDYLFGPHQLSDGSLRFMALATLLLQPSEKLPSVVIVDEPELGLHPSAVGALAGMIEEAAQHCQVILATQSPRLVDEFSPDQIVVAEWDDENRCSRFKALDQQKLAEWLERYSLSELWEKNVLGGQP